MSSSDFTCKCGYKLGEVKPSGILHPIEGAAELVFVDNKSGTSTFRCVACGVTVIFRGGRIDLETRRSA